MADLGEQLQKLQLVDSGLHWFCGASDSATQPAAPQPAEGNATLQLVISCFQVFAYDSEEIAQQKDFVVSGIDRSLGRCEDCIVQYYKSKRRFLDHLREEYQDEDVEILGSIFHDNELRRIQRGLGAASSKLASVLPPERRASTLDAPQKFAIVEALTCDKFLETPDNVMHDLLPPLTQIQANENLEVNHYIPAIPNFLLRDDGLLRDWARWAMLHIDKDMEKDDFDFAFRAVLERMVGKSLMPPFEPTLVRRLWSGMTVIVARSSKEIVTHSLRALDVDIYRAALEHLQVDDDSLRYILQTVRALLILSPGDLWEAMGAIGPITVAEQIFRSPRFEEIMLDARLGDSQNASTPLYDTLAWITPFMESLQIGQKPSVCRSIVEQLLSRCKSNAICPEARAACWRAATQVLALTLSACDEKSDLSDAVGRAVAADALTCGNAFIQEILEILERPDDDSQARALIPSCVTVIETTLALECKVLYNDRLSIIEGRRINSAKLTHDPIAWRTVVKKLHKNNLNLAKAILGSTNSLLALEKIKPGQSGQPAPEEVAVNRSLQELFDLVTEALERINYYDGRTIRRFSQYHVTVAHITTGLSAAEPCVHEAVLEVIKSMTGESFRSDALRSFLKQSLPATLDGMAAAAARISYLRNFGSCSRFLKVTNDVVNALCDSQDGVLRDPGAIKEETVEALKNFWTQVWEVLKMMYVSSETWNINKVASSDVLREFVRDIMQMSSQFFDQFNVFNYAIRQADSRNQVNPEDATEVLLQATADATEGIMRYLKLKDEYLLRTSAQLVRKLLTTLTKYGLKLPDTTTDFLTQVAIFNGGRDASRRIGTRTLLNATEIAGIEQDLEANVGHAIVQETRDRALLEKGLIGDETQSPMTAAELRRGGTLLQQQQKKQGTIDLGAWGIRAEGSKDQQRVKLPDHSKPKQKEPPKPGSSTGFDKKILGKPAVPARPAADPQSFLNERKKQKLEADRKRAEELARIKKNVPGLISNQTANEGSAIGRLGKLGRDHGPKGESMMVSSGSESSSDDEIDRDLFGIKPGKVSSSVAEYNAMKLSRMKHQGPVKKTRIQRSAKDMRARLAPQMTGLYAKFLAWDFFYEGSFPPGTSKEDYSFVSEKFRTVQDYKRAFEALLLLEAWSSFSKAREEGSFRTFEVKVANRISVDSLFEVSVTITQAMCKEVGVREADILLISKHEKPADSAQHPHCLGRVSRVRFKKGVAEVTIQVSTAVNVQPWMTQSADLHAVKVESIVTLEREYGALSGLEWYDLCQEILQAEISPILKYGEALLQKLMKIYRLNNAQAKAVQSAIDNDAFTLIQGPPGSGKTKTIVAIVGALLTETLKNGAAVAVSRPGAASNQPQAATNTKKLLVCAPSNAAVDELVMRFMQGVKTADGTFYKPKVVRLGRSDKVNPQVLSVTLDEQIEKIINPLGEKVAREESELEKAINAHKAADKQIKEMYELFEAASASGAATAPEVSKKFEMLKRDKQSWSNAIERLRDSGNTALRDKDIKRRQAEQRVLSDAHIICATLSGSARETFQHLTVDFESVVIDEAAQCIELSALIPLKYGCSKCIMVGDPKQLPPTVLSREAARFQYEQSLFVRMQRSQPDDVHLLDTQYRMHPAISRFPSRAFYDGRLLDGPDMAALRTQAWHQDPLLGPYRFFDVAGKHSAAPKGHSLVNAAEVDTAMDLYRRLTQSCRKYDFAGKIGVITPYKSQLQLLRERFSRAFGPDIVKAVEFNTTDAFQGRESEVIIFSCVRASDRGIGFLADIRRMNVGITRAKSSLWVLGNSKSLLQGEFWGAMIRDAQERELFTAGNVAQLLRETPRIQSDAAAPAAARRSSATVPPSPVDAKMSSASASPSDSDGAARAKKEGSHGAARVKQEDGTSAAKREDGAEIKKEPPVDPRLQSRSPAPRAKSETPDVVMKDVSSVKAEAKSRSSGTSTPKRKRSLSPPPGVMALAKPVAEDRGEAKVSKETILGRLPPPPRPRKPAGDSMFIKPKKRK